MTAVYCFQHIAGPHFTIYLYSIPVLYLEKSAVCCWAWQLLIKVQAEEVAAMPVDVQREIHLDTTEVEFLLRLLERSRHELLMEIRHSDSREFKRVLTERLRILDELVQRLQPAQ